MGEELTPSQQAAAFHGMATNRGRPAGERLALALQALDLYEAEVERLRAVRTVDLAGTGFVYRMADGTEVVLPPEEVTVYVAAGQVTPAERRGYEQAITHLRDTAERHEARGCERCDWRLAADYLSARLTEETTG